jgi:hypothetical protein
MVLQWSEKGVAVEHISSSLNGVTVVLRWCYSCVSVVQQCYSCVSVVHQVVSRWLPVA